MTDTATDRPLPALELTLDALPASVGDVRRRVRDFAVAHGADRETLVGVELAVSEAATNAVIHAFIGREPGRVRVVARAAPGELVVSVADDGRGMQPRTDSPGLGIGLPTIGQLTSSLDIHDAPGGGTEVHMTFAAPSVTGPALPEAGERARVLAEVAALAAGSGWPADGLEAMAELLVPAWADCCAVDAVGEDGVPARLAARVADDAALSAWLAQRPQQERYDESPTFGAVQGGAAQVIEVDGALLESAARDDEDLEALRRFAMRWWVTVPLREGERTLGLLHLGMRAERGRPSAGDVGFFELVADRATRGLANTRLIEDLGRTRRRLERILAALAEAITVHDAAGNVVYANEAARELLEAADEDEIAAAEPGELAARFRVTHADGTPVAPDEYPGRRMLSGGEARPLLTRSVHLASGRERWLLTKATLIDDEERLAVNIIEDVTETQVAERRQRFLALAGDVLIGVPDTAALQRLAELAVIELADWCAVDLRSGDRLERVGLAHRDPEKLAVAREIDRRWPPEAGDVTRALLDGGPGILVPEITAEMLAGSTRDAEHLRLMQGIGLRSVLRAPIRAGERTLGALSLITAESGHAFTADDLEFAAGVGRRIATALSVGRR